MTPQQRQRIEEHKAKLNKRSRAFPETPTTAAPETETPTTAAPETNQVRTLESLFRDWLRTPEGQDASDPRMPTDAVRRAVFLEDALQKAFNAGMNYSLKHIDV